MGMAWVWAWAWGVRGSSGSATSIHVNKQSRNDLIWGPGKNGDECTMYDDIFFLFLVFFFLSSRKYSVCRVFSFFFLFFPFFFFFWFFK
jgi:hypothetical protein